MGYQIKKAVVKNFRSISNLTIEFIKGELMVICGANNVGKTNFLRALDLFFSLNKDKFNAKKDIPYHIAEGSRGIGYKTDITVYFQDKSKNDNYKIQTIYTKKRDKGNLLEIRGYRNNKRISEEEAKKVVQEFRFILVESNNINLPKIISDIIKDDILPNLDRLRTKQTEPLDYLNKFINKSKEAVSRIENDITKYFKQYVNHIEGINSNNWEFKIIFPEFNYLREAISNLVTFTLYDTNKRPLETKGSGIQRMVLLALITYVSENSKDKVIWAIDEPEVFLQPSLQKKVYKEFRQMAKNISIIITTHAPHFIDISNVSNTHLFETTQETKEYQRKPGTIFIKVNTCINENNGFKKIETIRKHMGIGKNDSWNIVPFNILVEGEGDKNYLTSLGKAFGFEIPNILVAGSASKMPGYIEFLKEFCTDMTFKPEVVCLVDHDECGKSVYDKLKGKTLRIKELNIITKYIIRCDNESKTSWDYEIEDFIYTKLLFQAVNNILRKKNYLIINKGQRDNRFSISYKNMNILKYITESISMRNVDKERLDFESIGLKRYLCEKVCEIIKKNKQLITDLDEEQPVVKQFIKKLFKI